MLKHFLLALPLTAFVLLAGCDETNRGYAKANTSSPASSQTAAAPAPSATPQAPYRVTTTQPLPQGYGYLHEQDLSGGRLPNYAATQGQPLAQPQAQPQPQPQAQLTPASGQQAAANRGS